MAVRNFAGSASHRITCDPGNVGAILNGAHTIFSLVNVNTYGDPSIFMGIAGATEMLDWGSRPNERQQYRTPGGNSNGTVNSGDVGGDWFLHIVTKAAGTQTPRVHWRNITTMAAWGHAQMDAARASDATVPNIIRFGDSSGGFLNGRLAVSAIFNYAMTDAQAESSAATLSTMDLLNVSSGGAFPVAAWQFNQESVDEEVYDLTGGGADQATRTGTTVVTDDDPPGWSFIDAGGTPIHPEFDPTGVLG